MEMVAVYVSGIAVDREREHPVVLIKSHENDDVLPIWIGPAEATAIYSVLAGKTFERPMTHDLMKLIVDELGAEMSSIEITGIHQDTYFARIVLRRGEEVFYIDARPSDSIALALRTGASIYIDREIFQKYSRNLQLDYGDKDDVKKHLEGLDPGNFGDLEL
ncbi:MAG: bifunctional nuclease family protein [Candidatus Krumholzibacteriota bacterium]|nr:bifunctional nuclease family protein [Candidatus Krumholzibacteriota bacterium]